MHVTISGSHRSSNVSPSFTPRSVRDLEESNHVTGYNSMRYNSMRIHNCGNSTNNMFHAIWDCAEQHLLGNAINGNHEIVAD